MALNVKKLRSAHFGILALLLLASFSPARAEEVEVGGGRFQNELAREGLSRFSLEIDPEPAGKMIERFEIAQNDVIIPQDPYPKWPTIFHALTKREVVERELLIQVGDLWNAERITEAERALLTNVFLSSAQILPARGSAPDKVIAVVVTMDLWSLRPGVDFTIVGNTLQFFELEFAEHNLGGWKRRLGADFRIDLGNVLFGEEFREPRLFGSRVRFDEKVDLYLARSNLGVLEGWDANFGLGRPLFSLETEWAWWARAGMYRKVHRWYSGANLTVFSTSSGESVPYAYLVSEPWTEAGVTWSQWIFPRELKRDFSFLGGARFRHYENRDVLTSVSSAAIGEFNSNALPTDESFGFVALRADLYSTRFVREYDLETFALNEDLREGFKVRAAIEGAYGALPFIRPYLEAEWLGAFGPGAYRRDLLFAQARAETRYEPGLFSSYGTAWVNRVLSASIKNTTPVFLRALRLVVGARIVVRAFDLRKELSPLGGDRYLRGFPSDSWMGTQGWGFNAELRTQPLSWKTFHAGLAVFADWGDSRFAGPESWGAHKSVGAGFRFTVPQFMKEVLRLDFAFPLDAAPAPGPTYFTAAFEQAF